MLKYFAIFLIVPFVANSQIISIEKEGKQYECIETDSMYKVLRAFRRSENLDTIVYYYQGALDTCRIESNYKDSLIVSHEKKIALFVEQQMICEKALGNSSQEISRLHKKLDKTRWRMMGLGIIAFFGGLLIN